MFTPGIEMADRSMQEGQSERMGCTGGFGRITWQQVRFVALVFTANVCEHLGIADTAVSRIRPTLLSATDVEPVNAWIRECEVAWLEFDTVEQAKGSEARLLAEWMPLLSRR